MYLYIQIHIYTVSLTKKEMSVIAGLRKQFEITVGGHEFKTWEGNLFKVLISADMHGKINMNYLGACGDYIICCWEKFPGKNPQEF
jgi:hypothetical protein